MTRVWVRHAAFDVAILAAWMASVGLVVLQERGQLGHGTVQAARMLHAPDDANEQWFGIYYREDKVGFAHTVVVPEEREGRPGLSVVDRGRLHFSLLGSPQQVDVSARAFIDADWRVQFFSAQLQTASYQVQWEGRRRGEVLVVTMRTAQAEQTMQVRDPGGRALVAGLAPWSAFRHLAVGQWGRLWLFNPLALAPEEVYFHVRERSRLEGQDVLVIDTDVRGMTATSWVTPQGRVLRETSPLGWELRQESSAQALAHLGEPTTFDLLSTVAVPLDRPLPDPRRIERLVWLIEGLACDNLAVDRPWQRPLDPAALAGFGVGAPDAPWCLVELRRPAPPADGATLADAPSRYRAPSLFVQSDDARVRNTASEIVAGAASPWDQVRRLGGWVYRSLAKQLTVGLPSAVDVLARRSGDCHEHTVLFAALARSQGLPTRMVAGLVYYGDRLFYHAWPEVWVGAWVPTDPTLGQDLADATHLGLLEAETEQLLSLGKFVGQLRVQVLAVDESG